jgi:1-aminocyclopropane-1-carboxylate synthase
MPPSLAVSSPADVIWSSILSDRCALEDFLGENKRRLGAAQAFVRGWFEERGVEVAHSNA